MYRCCVTRIGHQEQNCPVKMKAHTCYTHSHTVNVLILTKVTASINTVHIKQITPKHLNGCIDLILFCLFQIKSNQINFCWARITKLSDQMRCIVPIYIFLLRIPLKVEREKSRLRSSHCIHLLI